MPIDPLVIAQILADEAAGEQIAVAQVVRVDWSSILSKYYSGSAFEEPPFLGSGLDIEARLLFDKSDPFLQYEKNADLRSSTVKISFDDIDGDIRSKFQTYRSGVNAEVFLYYPKYGAMPSEFFGQLVAPTEYKLDRVDTVISNGFRSPEQLIPSRPPQPGFCTANFGGRLPNAFAVRCNGCRYDKHLGGSLGELDPATGQPYLDCPKTKDACNARFGTTNGRYWLGFEYDAAAVRTDGPRSGYQAHSEGNQTSLGAPIRLIAGTKHVAALQPIQGREEDNSNDHSKGFFRNIYMISIGPNRDIYNLQIKGKFIEQSQQDIRYGTIAQLSCNYAPGVLNYSLTSHVSAAYGWVDPRNTTPNDYPAECDVIGYADVYTPYSIDAGAGLIGIYYAEITGVTETARKVDLTINFPSSSNPPDSGQRLELGFKIVWTGFITFPGTGSYTLSSSLNDDFVSVKVNGSTVFSATYPATGSGAFVAVASVAYPIEITYHNNGEAPGAFNPWGVILKWNGPSVSGTPVIPSTAFSHDADSGFNRQWTDDRVLWLWECYTNQQWGMAYDVTRFNVDEILATSIWGRETVSYIHVFPDLETQDLTGIRTTFNVIMEGRAYKDQIVDICLPANLAIPFQNDGEYTIRPIRPFTSGELSAAKVFTDRGQGRNIIWNGKTPEETLKQQPDDKIINTIKVAFEDASQLSAERTITVDKPQQKEYAGQSLGDGHLKEVVKNLTAFGVTTESEAVRFGRRVLKFGEFDAGGTENNLQVSFTTPMENLLGVVRYECIQIDSELLDGFMVGTIEPLSDGTFVDLTEQAQYFRITQLNKIAKGQISVVAQVYNRTAVEAFETTIDPGTSMPFPPPEPIPVPTPPTPPNPEPQPCLPTLGVATFDAATETIIAPIEC